MHAASAGAEDRPKVTWLALDWQPAWIFEGPWAGKGYAQTVEAMLQKEMPEYRHVQQQITNVRIYSTIKTTDACFAATYYRGTELAPHKREGLLFSAPTFVSFYHGVIANAEAEPKIAPYVTDGRVDFEALLADTSIKGGFQPGRTYSATLNHIFATDPNARNLLRWAGNTQLTQQQFRIIDAGRLDYVVDYYLVQRFYELSTGKTENYRFYPLKEHEGQFGLGGVACNDTPVGRDLIAKINAILKPLRPTEAYLEANARWLMPPEQKELYMRLWRDELLSRND